MTITRTTMTETSVLALTLLLAAGNVLAQTSTAILPSANNILYIGDRSDNTMKCMAIFSASL